MKVLLVEPNYEGYALMPTMSLAILKGFINQKTKHNAKIVDLVFHKKNWQEYLINQIRTEKPDLIGISVLSFNYLQAVEISKLIKKNFDIKILAGGVHAILAPEELINNDEIDIICTGEGEEVIKDLLDSGLKCKNVKGIWYKNEGKIIKNSSKKLRDNLDELPFPEWDDFEMEKYFLINNFHLPIMASRGCPYQCTYCSNHALKKRLAGKYVRFRSVDNVMKEIELRIKQYHSKGLKFLFFYDDTFIMYKDFVKEFCKKFKEKGFDKLVKWNVNVRANLVDEEVIKSMKDAGCYEVRMGVEAGNDYIRNVLYKRNMTKEQIFNAVKIIKDNGLQLRVQFIIGAPYENKEKIEESLNMAKKINPDYALFPILVPLPSTEIKEVCEKEGLIEKNKFKNSHEMFTNPVVKTKYLSNKEIKKIVNKIRIYQMRQYITEGLKLRGPLFIYDSLVFLIYYKRKYDLEIDHAFRFTINKYKLKEKKLLD
ncbi:MAG: B12-binding domain-containing radical SAM protein [Nanoarchaeota archaeon]